jgi:hypothetical protein
VSTACTGMAAEGFRIRTSLGSLARRVAAVGILVVSAAALNASTASAVLIYPQAASFGADGTSGSSFGEIRQAAFDQAGNRLYVLTSSPPRIHAFDVSAPGTYTPVGGAFPVPVEETGYYLTSDLAVDNSGLGTDGNIVYGAPNTNRFYSYDSAGALQPGFPTELDSPGGNDLLTGTGVDSGGNIWGGNWYPQAFEKFSSGGTRLEAISTIDGFKYSYPGRVAFDSANNMYLTHYTGSGEISKFTVADGYATKTQLSAQGGIDIEVNRATGKIYVMRYEGVDLYSAGGTFERTIGSGLSASYYGLAVDEGTGTIFLSDANSGKIRVFPPVNAPVSTTGGTSSLARNTVTLEGHVEPDGAGNVTDCHFEYVTDAAYKATGYTNLSSGGTKPCSDVLPIGSGEDVSAGLTGLTTDTTYHYRLVSANGNANSANPGADQTFKTPTAVTGLSADGSSDETQTSATLNASFDGDGLATTYKFEWGPTTAYGTVVEGDAGSPNGLVELAIPVTGLSVYLPESPPYHYRVIATNSTGTSVTPDKTFFAAPPHLPEVSGTSVGQVAPTSAILSSTINPGNGPTVYRFEYGETSDYGHATPITKLGAADDADHPVDLQLNGLMPGTTYQFRLVATNFTGTAHSPNQTFSTPDVPEIGSSTATSVGQTAAHLSASVIANASPTSAHFEYGLSSTYGLSTAPAFLGEGIFGQAVDADLSGLVPGTAYHYRVVAVNDVGTTYGPDRLLTTQAAPTQNQSKVKHKKCRKGFVRRNGKCVKKKKRATRRNHRNG